MYKIDDLIIYGGTGVCRVKEITTLDGIRGIDRKKKYYVLQPLFHDEMVYSPVDNCKVFMRSIISKETAEELINTIPTIQAEAYHNSSIQQLADHYEESFKSHDCGDLIELVMSIYAKKQYVQQQKKKFSQIDERFMHRAEELLYGELSVALEIPVEKVPAYISEKVAAAGAETEEQNA